MARFPPNLQNLFNLGYDYVRNDSKGNSAYFKCKYFNNKAGEPCKCSATCKMRIKDDDKIVYHITLHTCMEGKKVILFDLDATAILKRVHGAVIVWRPGLGEFIEMTKDSYAYGVFTDSGRDVSEEVIVMMEREFKISIQIRLYTEDVEVRTGIRVKPVSKLSHIIPDYLRRVILIDDNLDSTMAEPMNSILCDPFVNVEGIVSTNRASFEVIAEVLSIYKNHFNIQWAVREINRLVMRLSEEPFRGRTLNIEFLQELRDTELFPRYGDREILSS